MLSVVIFSWPGGRYDKPCAPTGRQVVVGLSRPHPELGYRSCHGLIRLGTTFPPVHLEAACDPALQIRGCPPDR